MRLKVEIFGSAGNVLKYLFTLLILLLITTLPKTISDGLGLFAVFLGSIWFYIKDRGNPLYLVCSFTFIGTIVFGILDFAMDFGSSELSAKSEFLLFLNAPIIIYAFFRLYGLPLKYKFLKLFRKIRNIHILVVIA